MKPAHQCRECFAEAQFKPSRTRLFVLGMIFFIAFLVLIFTVAIVGLRSIIKLALYLRAHQVGTGLNFRWILK